MDINTTIESGDWSYLQAIVAREANSVEKLDAIGIKTMPVITLGGTLTVPVESFVATLRLAMNGNS